ncbi:hypothetical protein G4B88_011804 [Cannabis sativa]|uniref:Partial AB-hydrolase lipase domain-containing protein n=1 Tax=Cannabis sativa TaxID=3483 RepID=A0A7J6FE57_CANSA|nr:hypothetical protein G4B88_011804 [Cannabis sativa]
MVGGAIGLVVVAVALIISNIPSETAAIRDVFPHKPAMVSPPQASTLADNDICKTLVEPQGYTCQHYQVTTEDGYTLGMQRIPAGRSGKKANKPPVLVQHGVLADAALYLVSSPEQCLPFILADNGYDVWLSNARGTACSRTHTSLSPNDEKFWDWSWVELGTYDLPAFIEGVHNQTGKKLHYVGHSLGTLMALSAFSTDFKQIDMIRSATLLSPIAYMNQIGSTLLKEITVFSLAEPTSMKNLVHLSQMIRTGTIRKYDYNTSENMKQYNQATPPAYDMSKIPKDFPLFMSYGKNDYLSDVKDVEVLLETIKDHDKDKLAVQYLENYAHMDFVMGNNTRQAVFEPLMAFIAQH